MAKFKVGDIIKANKESNERYGVTTQKNGWTGKVTSVRKYGDIFVKTLMPEEYEGRVFEVDERYFYLVEDKQNITHIVNKNTVIVKLGDGRKGVAKCSPDDKFNIAFGTALAVARAYGDKETEAKLLAEPIGNIYDNKELWVFIYEANKDKIKNPSTVTVGTQLKIPALPDELFDPNNMKAQHLIKKLQEQYLNQ